MPLDNLDLRREVGRASVLEAGVTVLGLLSSVVFARALGPEAFGDFFLLYALVEISNRAVSGVGEAAKKRISGGTVPAGEAVGATLGTALLAGGLATLVGVLAGPWLSAFTGVAGAGWWYAILVTFLGAFESLQVVVTAGGRVGREKLYDLIFRFDVLILQYAGVLLLGGPAGMAAGLATATVLVILLPARQVAPPAMPTRRTLAWLWEYARFAVVERLTVQTWSRINLILLGWLAGSTVTGTFKIAEDLSLPALFVVGATAAGVMARVSDRHRSGQTVAPALADALAYASILAIPILALVLAVPERIVVVLYDARYGSAAPYLVGLAVYQLLVSQSRPIAAALKGLDRPDVTARLAVVCFAMDVVVGVGLFVLVGPIGIVVGTVLAQAAWILAAASRLRRRFDALSLPRELAVEALGGVGVYVVATTVATAVPWRSWPSLLAVVLPSALVYVLVLGAFGRTRRLLRDLASV